MFQQSFTLHVGVSQGAGQWASECIHCECTVREHYWNTYVLSCSVRGWSHSEQLTAISLSLSLSLCLCFCCVVCMQLIATDCCSVFLGRVVCCVLCSEIFHSCRFHRRHVSQRCVVYCSSACKLPRYLYCTTGLLTTFVTRLNSLTTQAYRFPVSSMLHDMQLGRVQAFLVHRTLIWTLWYIGQSLISVDLWKLWGSYGVLGEATH